MNAVKTKGGLTTSIDGVKNDIRDILESGNFYCNDDLAREMTKITNALDHMRLNENLDCMEDQRHYGKIANASSMLNKVSSYLLEYRKRMHGEEIKGTQENQLRERHQWALANLTAIQDEMHPYATNAENRIKEFGDVVGVTDRYTGYRNNLLSRPDAFGPHWTTRSQTTTGFPAHERGVARLTQPFIGGTRHDDVTFGNVRPWTMHYKGFRTIDSLYPRRTVLQRRGDPAFSQTVSDVKTINQMNAQLPPPSSRTATGYGPDRWSLQPYPCGLSVQELAGINMEFPGSTEYKIRYTQPPTDLPTSHFVINPKPDYSIYGRPLGDLPAFCPKKTEYQYRYQWPDGTKLVKLPWLRN